MRRAAACSIAACLALGLSACGQEAPPEAAAPAEPAAAQIALNGETAGEHEAEAEEIIEARQGLMIQMRVMMLPIDMARLDEPFDLSDARRNVEAISAMMMAVPHLYPEGTEAGSDHGDAQSLALPAVWERKEDFHAMAERTASMAHTMVLIDNEEIFRERAEELREACNACHAMFQEGYN